MNRLHLVSWVGLGLVSLVVLSHGTRQAIQAQDRLLENVQEPLPIDPGPSLQMHVKATPRSVEELKTWFKLQEKVAMDFPNETSLEEVIKYIRKSTVDPKAGFPKGIPIWVDPQGLTDSDKTMASPVRLELDEMPLQLTLRLITSQLGMTYELNPYGLIVITSTGCNDGEPLSEEAGNWQAFDMLRQEVRALRLEVRELRRGDRTERPAVPPRGLPGGNAPNGGFGGGMR